MRQAFEEVGEKHNVACPYRCVEAFPKDLENATRLPVLGLKYDTNPGQRSLHEALVARLVLQASMIYDEQHNDK